MSNSLQPVDCSLSHSSVHGILQTRKSWTGLPFLLQGIFPTQGLKLYQKDTLDFKSRRPDSSPPSLDKPSRDCLGMSPEDLLLSPWETSILDPRPLCPLVPPLVKAEEGGGMKCPPLDTLVVLTLCPLLQLHPDRSGSTLHSSPGRQGSM